MILRWALWAILFLSLPSCAAWQAGPDQPFLINIEAGPSRLNSRSPWYPLAGEQVELYSNYCGWDVRRQERVVHIEIGDKVKRMVDEADEMILATFFLFDNLYAEQPPGDYVDELANLLIAKKKECPSMPVVLILDLFNKAWGHRHSQVVDRLVRAGVDVFYSDLLESRSALRFAGWEALREFGQGADRASGGVLGLPFELLGRAPLPIPGAQIDGDVVTFAAVANGLLLKANHRKALVTKRRGEYEALTTSWNPHNPSLLHENHALSVSGPLARFVYLVLREDVRKSIDLERGYVDWSNPSSQYRSSFLQEQLPPLPEAAWRPSPRPSAGDNLRPVPEAAFATEEAIEPILMQWLRDVGPDDRVRIQMFYLGRVAVINAILDAAARTRHPIEILLDPNRVGINYSSDGTPNAQVADYLMEFAHKENAPIEIRWYATHGEQNHAKAMSITNEKTGKYLLTLGSANWTRKNLAGINMEDNIFVRHSAGLNQQFDALFDRLWSNEDPGIEYSVAWNDPRYNYDHGAGRDQWAAQERWMFLWPRFDDQGRPLLLEKEVVHW